MAFKVVWRAIIQGRDCVVKRCSYFDTQKEIDEYNRKMKEAGLSQILQYVWYCGYIEVKPEDGEIYDMAVNNEDFKLDLIFPSAYRGITWCGGIGVGDADTVYIGFDTNHYLEKWRKFHERK